MTDSASRDAGTLTAGDGVELAWRSWEPDHPRGRLVVVHGLAEHSGRYEHVATALAANGWAVHAVDLRSHGLSYAGPQPMRVHVDSFDSFFLDVAAITALSRSRYPDLVGFLLGHSMGGLLALRYTLENPEEFAGTVLSSPALGIHPDSLPSPLLRPLVGIASKLMPAFCQKMAVTPEFISHDPAVVQAYTDDPLVSDRVSLRWYAGFVDAIARAHELAPKLQSPILLMQSGDDRLVDARAAERWVSAAPGEKVEYLEWPGMYHEMLNETGRQQVMERIFDWLGRQPQTD